MFCFESLVFSDCPVCCLMDCMLLCSCYILYLLGLLHPESEGTMTLWNVRTTDPTTKCHIWKHLNLANYVHVYIITECPRVWQTCIWYFLLQNWMMKTSYLKPSYSSWPASTQHPQFCALSVTSWPHIQTYRHVCRRRSIRHCNRMAGSSHTRLSTAWSTWTWSCQVRTDLVYACTNTHKQNVKIVLHSHSRWIFWYFPCVTSSYPLSCYFLWCVSVTSCQKCTWNVLVKLISYWFVSVHYNSYSKSHWWQLM